MISNNIVVLDKAPRLVGAPAEITNAITDIYNGINALSSKLTDILNSTTVSQEDRAALWAGGNLQSNQLAKMSRKLYLFETDAVHGDIISLSLTPPYDTVNNNQSLTGRRNILGMCLDTVSAGSYGYVYSKGIVQYNRAVLTAGSFYGALIEDMTPANRNILIRCNPISGGARPADEGAIGVALRSDILLLNTQQSG